MWTFVQGSGSLYRYQSGSSAVKVANGYSGSGDGLNNGDLQEVKEIGPIPVGDYTIESPIDTDTHGPFVLPLTPDPKNVMHERSGFLIHGDSNKNPGDHVASKGCIILPRIIREQIWNSGDHLLKVIRVYL